MKRPLAAYPQSSLLDRLGDDEEASASAGATLARLKQGLKRDLENLLNTRRRFLSWPQELEELDRSLLSYGLSDFTNSPIRSDEFRSAFVREVEGLLARLEPRITSFDVALVDSGAVWDRLIHFRIRGLVRFGDERQEISFDSHVDPVRCGVVLGA